MISLTLTAPAKVNIFLKVLNKRRDSYHNIFTLFERISLHDTIRLSKIPKGIIVSSDTAITRDQKDNLAYKAAKLILSRDKAKGGVKIEIKKKIPLAAGLGGGSSDAASVLTGMNKLFSMKLDRKELARLGEKLGADVPFFILNTPFAIGKAKGNRLDRVWIKTRFWHLLIYPGFKSATKSVYEKLDVLRRLRRDDFALTRQNHDVKINLPLKHPIALTDLEPMLYNDLEEIVVAKEEAVGMIIKRLASFLGKKAIISGSGPSVFCLYDTRKEAMKAKDRLIGMTPARERKLWQVFVVGTA